MASPILITRDNFSSLLKRSTEARSGTPDGNVFLDPVNSVIQLITLGELATVDLGAGLEANPLTNVDKIQTLALYFFILQEVEADPSLQNFRFAMDAVSNRMGKLVGATAFLNAIKLDSTGSTLTDERQKVADSGFQEFAAGSGGNTLIDRVYHGAKSLNEINATSQPFYQIVDSLSEADRQAVAPTDFSKQGSVNEVIQTFGSTANGDSGAGNFDSLGKVLILGVRDYGFSVGEVDSQGAGVPELGAYSQGYGFGNAAVAEIAAISEADVFGGGQIAPFTGLGLFREAAPFTVTGFVGADQDFTDRITNTGGATLIQIRAWLDKLMQEDVDSNDNTANTGSFIPKRAEPLYTINAAGKLVTRSGLFIDGILAEDEQSIIFTSDSGTSAVRPVITPVAVTLSQAWFDDTAGWFRLIYDDGAGVLDFNTDTAVTVTDGNSSDVAGDNTDARLFPVSGGYELRFSYDYALNTEAGLTAGTDKAVVFQVGGVDKTKSRTFSFTLGASSISFDASTEAETN